MDIIGFIATIHFNLRIIHWRIRRFRSTGGLSTGPMAPPLNAGGTTVDIPSGDVKIAIENCDFPIKNGDFPLNMAIDSEFSP